MQVEHRIYRKKIETQVEQLPVLPATVKGIIELCSSPEAPVDELSLLVATDPVLSGQLFKLVNSAHYALVSEITSLSRAITLLGFNTVKTLALSAVVIKAVSKAMKTRNLPVAGFWTHSISVGVAALLLDQARHAGSADRDDYLLGGLLHDLGKVFFGSEYQEVLTMVENEPLSLIEAEQQVLGIDHQEIGLLIARKWNFDENLIRCIGFHHNPPVAEGQDRQQVTFIALGDVYSNIYDLGYSGNFYPSEAGLKQLLSRVDLRLSEFAGIRDSFEDEYLKARVFLQI
ncbi:MAG: HDOD domain-containing protein [Desulfocapsaceae bacterium]